MRDVEVLFDPQATLRRWDGSRALVPIQRDCCPSCFGTLREVRMTEAALFFHGGYGASRETTSVSCEGCTWTLVVEVSEVRPDRKVA